VQGSPLPFTGLCACGFASARLCGILGTRAGTVVTEWIVTLANCLPKAGLLRTRHEIEAFLRVPRDSVE
jgi:hypothetical protein